MTRDIPIDFRVWGNFEDPPLREQEFSFRRMPTHESTFAHHAPENEYQALMEAAPGEEPEATVGEILKVRYAVADAIGMLTPQDQFIIEALHVERLSHDQLARRLGLSKTHTHRLAKEAEQTLKRLLESNPTIKETLVPKTWNEVARQHTTNMSPVGAGISDSQARRLIERKINLVRYKVRAGVTDPYALGEPLHSIGIAAAAMLDNRGMWDAEEMVQLLCRKQHDYGHANINAFGMVGVGVRCSDKVARFINLTDKNAVGTAEPLEDALLDMVGYAVIAVMLLSDEFKLELES